MFIFILNLKESFSLINSSSLFSITILLEHLEHACLLYPEKFSSQPPN